MILIIPTMFKGDDDDDSYIDLSGGVEVTDPCNIFLEQFPPGCRGIAIIGLCL